MTNKEQNQNGKTYLPATDVGQHFGYTKDYILMLIKQGKIDGKKIGHKWYAHLPSATEYFHTAKQEQAERRQAISRARRQELKHHTKIRKNTHRHTALVETLAIVVIGLTIGVTGYVGSATTPANVSASDHTFLEYLAISLYTALGGEPRTQVAQVISLEDSALSTTVGTTTHTSLIVAPEEIFTATDVEAIKDSFADPVTVTPDESNPGTGIVTPRFKDREGESYRFLLVPLEIGSTGDTADTQADTNGSVISNGMVPVTPTE